MESKFFLDFPSLQLENVYESSKVGNPYPILQTGEAPKNSLFKSSPDCSKEIISKVTKLGLLFESFK